ncbi:family 2A encapsulin nanocompartment cargo protein cysteine desulfurase [Sorangium atrum]|uniref:Cysteine desulfurase n=1 Tax=Sorangium atrum TaxID=2995308 RepID=A0ABT5BTA9_9BACT|nr:family 2A encapsulin nanocompartment cargo protein cysteine desulfurase [Sorangium aterium]MDC0676784.1 family 2A encapsulin nanocompartment cargo protein cysteine desulfurase [Sorangium aterium]
MSTSEIQTADLQGALPQVTRVVGSSGIAPLNVPLSAPGVAPASAPEIPGFDPASLAAVIAQLANEMLGAPFKQGAAAAPAAPPAPTAAPLPGAAPSQSPVPHLAAAGATPSPVPGPSAAAAPVYPGSAPAYSSSVPAYSGSAPAYSGSALPAAGSVLAASGAAPASPGEVSLPGVSPSLSPAPPVQAPGATPSGVSPSLSPAPPVQASGATPSAAAGPSAAAAPVYPGSAPAAPGAAPPAPGSVPAYSGATPAFPGEVSLPDSAVRAGFVRVPLVGSDPLSLGAADEVLRIPVLGDLAGRDADAYFVPGAPALGIESPVGPPQVEAHEIRAVDPALVRDLSRSAGILDPHAIRRDFPILDERVHNKRLVWLDNAATTQKPRAVIDRLSYFYEHENSNIHRAAHALAARATDAYEAAREATRRFINAPSTREIVFVRGTTEGINLIAQSWGRRNVGPGDEIVITWLEHHANIVPWQQLCSEKGARLRVAPVDDRGQVILEEYEKLLGPRTRIVSITQVSNALGTITPAREMVAMAHRHGARVIVDGAQAVSHMRADVQLLDCDFYVFSGHKVFGPTGIGAVFGKSEVLDAMPPWQGGGNMIADVTFERTIYHPPPARFEAGTGNIADAVGLGAALDYVTRIGIENIGRYEHELLHYATHALASVPGLRLIGTAADKAGVLSFVLDGQRTEDVGGALDREGIAVRSGHHCAQPILRRFGLESTVRASLAPYNTCEDIDALVDALHRIQIGRSR